MSYRDATGRQIQRSTKIAHTPDASTPKERASLAAENKRAAQALANELEGAERGNPTEHQLRKLLADMSERLFGNRLELPSARNYLNEWLEGRDLSASTRTRYAAPIRRFLEMLGTKADLPLTNVTPADLDRYARERMKGSAGASTVAVDVKALNVPFAAATRAGIIPFNPIARAQPIHSVKEARLPFTRQEVNALLDAAPSDDWKTAIQLGAFAGLRIGDATNLDWEAVDLFAETLNFRPQKTARQKRDLLIPLAPSLKAHLAALPIPSSGKGPLTPTLAGTQPGGRRGLAAQFSRIMEAAEVDSKAMGGGDEGRTFNRKSFHSLRHTFVSELERVGIAPDLRMKLAGHSDSKSHGRYTHTELETLAQAVARL